MKRPVVLIHQRNTWYAWVRVSDRYVMTSLDGHPVISTDKQLLWQSDPTEAMPSEMVGAIGRGELDPQHVVLLIGYEVSADHPGGTWIRTDASRSTHAHVWIAELERTIGLRILTGLSFLWGDYVRPGGVQ